jgi:hypothetical protein
MKHRVLLAHMAMLPVPLFPFPFLRDIRKKSYRSLAGVARSAAQGSAPRLPGGWLQQVSTHEGEDVSQTAPE